MNRISAALQLRPRGRRLLLVAWLVAASEPALACAGDCDGDGTVVIGELLTGVAMALARDGVAGCATFDDSGDQVVDVGELVRAVQASLLGCPPPSATPTPSPAPMPTRPPSASPVPPSATPTRTPNRAPQILCRDVYRTFTGQPARVPIPAIDPDGGGLSYSARGLPRGAHLDAAAGVIEWTPGDRQVGAYYAPFTAADAGQPVRSASGLIAFQVAPLDPCTTPHCDAALGCAPELAPLTTACCVEEERQRLVEPSVDCPGGRVLHLGRNGLTFGRLQNCDGLRVVNFAQIGALVGLNVEARCLNASAPVTLHVRLETVTRLLFDHTIKVTLVPAEDGFSRLQQEPLEVLGPGPFFEFEGAEALLTASATDVDGVVLSRQLRLVLTFGRPDMLADEVAPLPRDTPEPCTTAGP